MIGESYGDTSSSLVTGNTLNSYQNGAKLTLSIPEDFTGKLYYFCTYHDTMIQELLVGGTQGFVDIPSNETLTIAENQPVGSVVTQFRATSLNAGAITYGLIVTRKAKAISAGAGHTLVLLEDGTVWSTGLNEFGQLGDGTTENRNKPVQVHHANGEPLSGVKSVLASSWTSTFIMEDGTMWSVGRNIFGQLGNGGGPDQTRPVQVLESNGSAVSDASFGTAGDHHILFVRKDGSLWSFGFNNEGQLGDGTQSDRSHPVAVKFADGTAVVGVRSVSANDTTSLIALEDGTLWGFGYNGMRQLGWGITSAEPTLLPCSSKTALRL